MYSDNVHEFVLYYYNLNNYSGFNKDPRQNKIELHVFVPKDIIFGKYSISGKILLLPIAGNGDLTFVYGEFLARNWNASSIILFSSM